MRVPYSLSPEELDLLRGAVRRWRPELESVVDCAESGTLSPDQAGELRMVLMNEVSTDPQTGELDSHGRAVDALIDRLPWW